MKIEAKDVSVDGLRINEEVCFLLDKYHIQTYADLKREISVGNYDIKSNYLLSEALIDFQNISRMQQEISLEKLKLIARYRSETVRYNMNDIDSIVRAIDIPYFTLNRNIYHRIFGAKKEWDQLKNRHSEIYTGKSHWKYNTYEYAQKQVEMVLAEAKVKDLKEKASITSTNWKGEVDSRLIILTDYLGREKFYEILKSIEFYDRYIEHLLAQKYDVDNPFYFMHDEKLKRVRDNIVEILSFLDQEGYEFIFGNMGSLLEIAKNSSEIPLKRPVTYTGKDKKLIAVMNILANYITFDETMDVTNPAILRRFITPYGKK